MAKKHKHKGAHAVAKHATARRTFGHGRKPPHHGQPSIPPEAAGPMPGPHEFSGPDEAAMRQGVRRDRGAPPTDGGMQDAGGEPDADDLE